MGISKEPSIAYKLSYRLARNCLVLAFTVFFIAGCTKSVPVVKTFPSPVIEPLPLKVGVRYQRDFVEYKHVEKIENGAKYKAELGPAQVELFDKLFAAMFENTIQLEENSQPPPKTADIDAIIEPRIDDYVFITPKDNGSEFYEVSIRYMLSVFTPDGELLNTWPVTGFGRTRAKTFKSSQVVGDATYAAMRDAAAIIAIEFRNTAGIKQLTEQHTRNL